MKKREVFKEKEYYEKWVTFSQDAIKDYSIAVANPGIDPTHRTRLKYSIFLEQLHLFLLKYSQGKEIADLNPNYADVIISLEEYHKEEKSENYNLLILEEYVTALWLVSIGILTSIDNSLFERLIKIIYSSGKKGYLLDFFISNNSGNSMIISENILHPKQYSLIISVIKTENKNEQINLLLSFLKKYYKSMKNCYWYDTHKEDNTGFFGYWCFELAAIVKILNIDDTCFADNIFHPRDLTGKKLYRTWEDSKEGNSDRNELQALKQKNGCV